MRVGLMVEGQNGLTWERWSHILALAERLGFASVFRSDHYLGTTAQSSIEAYLSLAVAAKETRTIRFGPLVTPVTFRRPVDVGRMAAQIDVLSGGRFVMGLGAGWNEGEHRAFGLDFPPTGERFDRLEDAIRMMKALWAPGPATYEGRFYRLDGADCLPKPEAGRPPLLIGGGGEKRTLKLVARYADEWNGVMLSPDAYRQKVEVLERHCEAEKRDPATIGRSMMSFALVGPTQADRDAAATKMMAIFGSPAGTSPADFQAAMRRRGFIAGSTDEVVDTLGQFARHGLQEIQFQHLNYDSDAIPEYLAAEIAPRVRDL